MRAQPVQIQTEQARAPNGEVRNLIHRNRALKYPFNLVRDDNPRGRPWVRMKLAASLDGRTALPDGRVRVEPAGVLALPDVDAPIEEYPSLKALLAARLQRNTVTRVGGPPPHGGDRQPALTPTAPRRGRPHLRVVPSVPARRPPLSTEAEGRLIALPETLRAWAREELLVRLHLARHVHDGIPLGECLARIGQALGDLALRLRVERPRSPHATVRLVREHPWCTRHLECGLVCRALASVVVTRPDGNGAIDRCADCAAVDLRAGARRLWAIRG